MQLTSLAGTEVVAVLCTESLNGFEVSIVTFDWEGELDDSVAWFDHVENSADSLSFFVDIHASFDCFNQTWFKDCCSTIVKLLYGLEKGEFIQIFILAVVSGVKIQN